MFVKARLCLRIHDHSFTLLLGCIRLEANFHALAKGGGLVGGLTSTELGNLFNLGVGFNLNGSTLRSAADLNIDPPVVQTASILMSRMWRLIHGQLRHHRLHQDDRKRLKSAQIVVSSRSDLCSSPVLIADS